MKKFIRILTVVLSLLILVSAAGLMTACGNKKNELIVFTMFGGEDPLVPAYKTGVEAFKAANPKVNVNDQSIQATGESFDAVAESKFVVGKYMPDVLYVFSPGRNLSIQPYLATVADVRAKHPDYGQGFPVVNGDPHTLAFLGNTFGMYYEKSKFTDDDFASFGALKSRLTALGKNEVVNFAGEPHYWLNYIGLQTMGQKWADVSVPTKEYFTANKTELINVVTELKAYFNAIGLDESAAIQYGNEKEAMWNGNKAFDINGNWNAAGFYAPHSTAGKANLYDFKSLVIDNKSGTADDESEYVLSGFFHGWMISKKCYENPDKLALAVDFINKQCENVLKFGGLAANGAKGANDTDLAKATKAVLEINGAKFVSPLDDKFLDATAKTTLFNGLTSMLQGASGYTPAKVIEDTIAAFSK